MSPISAMMVQVPLPTLTSGRTNRQRVWFVDDDATGNGTSWDDAFETLQDALAVAKDGNEIWVAGGTYKPTAGGVRAISFEMVEGVGIYGGFAGTEFGRYQRDWTTYRSILSGDINVVGNASDNSYHVVKGADNATLDGFTITDGNANGPEAEDNFGGGIYSCDAATVISNCVITDNNAYSSGGGLYSDTTPGHTCSPILTNCVFTNNTARSKGGGIVIMLHCDNIVLTNCTFSRNYADYGGGLYTRSGTKHVITNCIFWGNDANTSGDEIYNSDGYKGVLRHCDVNGCGGSGAGWDPDFGVDGGGNLDDDPCFVYPGDYDGPDNITGTFDDGLRLDSNSSPCIDAGDGDAAPLCDMMGLRRYDINGVSNTGAGEPNYVDIGAYEFYPKLVHFSDAWVADRYVIENSVEAFNDTGNSDIIGVGNYPTTSAAIPVTLGGGMRTLDGIAIHPGVKVTIYPNANYSGTPLLEKVGPAVIFNVWWQGEPPEDPHDYMLTERWKEPLQSEFPASRRFWSGTEMTDGFYENYWTGGSMKIEKW